jgi:RNA polymerase sigma-70 factor (ECF subfamily)
MTSANAAALTELLIQEREPLLRFLRRYLDKPACEDTYQSMYFKVVAVPGDPPIEDKRAYLYRVAYHHAVDRSRTQAREQKLFQDAAELLNAEPAADSTRVVFAREELRRITEVILALPERTREIFVLSRYHGLPEREIAARLGISKSLVAKHIYRALRFIEQGHGT